MHGTELSLIFCIEEIVTMHIMQDLSWRLQFNSGLGACYLDRPK
jgi:hypothetical protein